MALDDNFTLYYDDEIRGLMVLISSLDELVLTSS